MPKDELFKALAEPTRRGILRFLGKGAMTAGEIAAKFQISAPSMSHHFTVLKGADLIFARREGQQIFYSLNTTALEDLMTVLLDIFRSPNGKRSKS
jgi:DNA-binding transcriptional ArsR family regulator